MVGQAILKFLFPEITDETNRKENLFSARRLGFFLIALVQLIALLFVVKKFAIEKNSGISEISPIIISSFIITTFLPLRFRPFVFFTTSIVVIYFAFGFFSGSLLIGGGLTLFAICHLPMRLLFKSILIVFVFTVMSILRADLFHAPRAALIVPFLASMFMFRIILYLYEQKYNPVSVSFWQRLNYFFLFPNSCFLFFPIVDFKTSVKTYYSIPDNELWQKGIRWILRGVFHIIGYRIIYHYVFISSTEVIDLTTLFQHMFSSYALILRLSGLFHFIIGLLCMFGFNLPPAFNNYFLATGFVDLWRRINIYWREFMLKIFFYPVLFKIRKRIPKYALPVAMICVFIVTWLLHNYQFFWLRGNLKIVATDIVFWLTLGACITINAVLIEKSLLRLTKQKNRYLNYFFNTLKTCVLFLFMSVMWSLWTSDSIDDWVYLLSKGSLFSSHQILNVILVFICILLSGVIIQLVLDTKNVKRTLTLQPQKTLFLTIPVILFLFLCSFKTVTKYFPEKCRSVIQVLLQDKFNENDKRKVEAGYYKKVIDGEENASTGLWEINLKEPKKKSRLADQIIRTNTILSQVLKPGTIVQMDDHYVQVNSLGLRDKEYDFKKPLHTYRIALLGGSYEMGSGVSNNEVYESIAEEKLNQYDTNGLVRKYEILNFAVYGYHLLQHVELCNTKVFDFNPDAIIYVAHTGEQRRFLDLYSQFIRNGTNLKYPFLEYIKRLSGVKQSMSNSEIIERLRPFAFCLITWCYMQIREDAYKNNVSALWAYLPATDDVLDLPEFNKLKHLASQLNFIILDMRGVYRNVKREDFQISKTNTHPNAKGHAIIAQKFYEELVKNKKQMMKSIQ